MSNVVDVPACVFMIILGTILAFWGIQLSRIMSSIIFGTFLGYMAWKYSYTAWGSPALPVILLLIGLLVGFALGFILLRFSISLIAAYILASILVNNLYHLVALVVVLTLVFFAFSRVLLSAVLATTGVLMVYKGLTIIGIDFAIILPLCVILAIIGFYNQRKRWF